MSGCGAEDHGPRSGARPRGFNGPPPAESVLPDRHGRHDQIEEAPLQMRRAGANALCTHVLFIPVRVWGKRPDGYDGIRFSGLLAQ